MTDSLAHDDRATESETPAAPKRRGEGRPDPYLSVVIPMYNETGRMSVSMPRLIEFFATQPYSSEIVVVDDGSADGTADMARKLLEAAPVSTVIQSHPNRGKGHAVKLGMLAANGRVRLFCDADLSTPLHELDKFWTWLDQGYKVVIGSRKMSGAHITRHQPLWRESLGKVFTWLTNRIATRGISDITCGFKVFTAEAAEKVFARSVIDDWSFDAEVLFIAQRNGFRIKEVPVTWHDTPGTKVRLAKDAIKSLLSLGRIRLNGLRGVYR